MKAPLSLTPTDSAEMWVEYTTTRRFYRGYWIPGGTFRLHGAPESSAIPCPDRQSLVSILARMPENI